MNRDEVPEALIEKAIEDSANAAHEDLCGCNDWPNECVSAHFPAEFESGNEADIIAAVHDEIEKTVRTNVAAKIEANANGGPVWSAATLEAAEIARGER